MGTLRKTIHIILYSVAIATVVGSLLSIFNNTDSRYLKMLDFPRIQFFITSFTCLILFLSLTKRWQWYDHLLMVSLIGSMIVQGNYLVNYTSLVADAVPAAKEGSFSSDDQISILLVNVKMSNKKSQPLLDLVKNKMPDLLIAMEIDDWWEKQLETIETDYPFTQETTNNAAYGMTLYSKFPLKELKVNYLQNEKVPSFESVVQLKNGKSVRVYSVHPVPPAHFEDLPDNEGQREAEMVKVGNMIEDENLPTIVAGDINDVSWAATDELTGTKDLLYDVRVGRGFYNSYNANNIFMRWPLDHFFVTKEFRLITLERQPGIGSDHYPIYVKLVL
jgi:endonuclease/exonuclease/phosphatase (EEP) superfamily protein YafD